VKILVKILVKIQVEIQVKVQVKNQDRRSEDPSKTQVKTHEGKTWIRGGGCWRMTSSSLRIIGVRIDEQSTHSV
jgi:hypothetical protein